MLAKFEKYSLVKRLLTLVGALAIVSACQDEFSNRTHNAQSTKDSNNSSQEHQENLLTDTSNMPFQAAAWPTPKAAGFLAKPCPPNPPNSPCESDSIAAIAGIDIMSRALHTHSSIPIETAVNSIIILSKNHPRAKFLAVLGQIAECSKKIATVEYERALKVYNDNQYLMMSLSEGRRRFLQEKGIKIPTNSGTMSGEMNDPPSKLTLRQALQKFGDRSAPTESNQMDINGRPLLSQGATRCNQALFPFTYETFVTEVAKYPVSLSIIAPSNAMNILPTDQPQFIAQFTNTYEQSGITWEIDQMIGSIGTGTTPLHGKLTISNMVKDPVSATIKASIWSYSGNLTASTQIKITPPVAVNVSCGAFSYYGSSNCEQMETFGQKQLSANVTGLIAGADRNVVWSIQSGPGTIDQNGLFVAPTEVSASGVSTYFRATLKGRAEFGETNFHIVNRPPFVSFYLYNTSIFANSTVSVFVNLGLMKSDSTSLDTEKALSSLIFELQPAGTNIAITRSGSTLNLAIPAMSQQTAVSLTAKLSSGRIVSSQPLSMTILPQNSQPGMGN